MLKILLMAIPIRGDYALPGCQMGKIADVHIFMQEWNTYDIEKKEQSNESMKYFQNFSPPQ